MCSREAGEFQCCTRTACSTPSEWRRPCRERPGWRSVKSLGRDGDRATARMSTADSSRPCTRHSECEWQRLQTALRGCCDLQHTREGGSARGGTAPAQSVMPGPISAGNACLLQVVGMVGSLQIDASQHAGLVRHPHRVCSRDCQADCGHCSLPEHQQQLEPQC